MYEKAGETRPTGSVMSYVGRLHTAVAVPPASFDT